MFRFIVYQLDESHEDFVNKEFYERSSMWFNRSHVIQAMAKQQYRRVANVVASNMIHVVHKIKKGEVFGISNITPGDIIEDPINNRYIVAHTGSFEKLEEAV